MYGIFSQFHLHSNGNQCNDMKTTTLILLLGFGSLIPTKCSIAKKEPKPVEKPTSAVLDCNAKQQLALGGMPFVLVNARGKAAA